MARYRFDASKLSDVKVIMHDDERDVAREFFRVLADLSLGHTVIAIGYNSSSATRCVMKQSDCGREAIDYSAMYHRIGYDLPWLLERSQLGYTRVTKQRSVKYLGRSKGLAIIKLHELPKVYFVDMLPVVMDDLLFSKKMIKSCSLENVCQAYGIKNAKLSIDHRE